MRCIATRDAPELGAFSISLAGRDLAASREFYEKLGFEITGGDADQGWLILRNGASVLGLFAGMFEKNMLTFNPGWITTGAGVEERHPFTDVRELQARLEREGLTLTSQADPDSTGPASIMLEAPDGNPILIDQHRG